MGPATGGSDASHCSFTSKAGIAYDKTFQTALVKLHAAEGLRLSPTIPPIQLPQTYYLLYFTISLQKIPLPITPSLQPFPSYPFPLYTIPHSLTIYLSFLNSEKNSTVFVLL